MSYSKFFSKHRWKIISLLIVISSIMAIFITWQKPCRRISGPYPQDAYVWQRSWTNPVNESVRMHNRSFSGIYLLGAEVTWNKGQPETFKTKFDHVEISRSETVGVVLRIGAFSGPFSRNDERTKYLTDLCKSLIHELGKKSVNVSELQIDFDCAESKLAGYRIWVEEFRKAIAPVPLVVTALPSWLKQREFKKLAYTADGYVLQVHSLSRPKDIKDSFSLCDPVAAKEYVERAAKIGRPFRVALPTYGYMMAFAPDGKFIGLSAEGRKPNWPAGTSLRRVSADPAEMAGLVSGWKMDRPELMQGVIWYRLPVEGDELNWSWQTLSTVMHGEVPSSRLKIAAVQPGKNLYEIVLKNVGDDDYLGAVEVRMDWGGAKFIAGDSINGFGMERDERNVIRFKKGSDGMKIRPGERKKIGWVRFEENSEVNLEIVSAK